jgi:mono/diheme cytochrome c family protein
MVMSRLLILAAALVLVVGQVFAQRGQTPAEPATPARAARGDIEHGRYIIEGVAMCFECHSTRDGAGSIIPGTRFMGGPLPVPSPPWAANWAVRTPRIAGLPGYTTETGIRLLTQGAIGRDGTQLRPPMPRFRMSPQDAADVVAYLKSIS